MKGAYVTFDGSSADCTNRLSPKQQRELPELAQQRAAAEVVDGEVDAVDGRRRITRHESRSIPGLGLGHRPERRDGGVRVGEGRGHGSSLGGGSGAIVGAGRPVRSGVPVGAA